MLSFLSAFIGLNRGPLAWAAGALAAAGAVLLVVRWFLADIANEAVREAQDASTKRVLESALETERARDEIRTRSNNDAERLRRLCGGLALVGPGYAVDGGGRGAGSGQPLPAGVELACD